MQNNGNQACLAVSKRNAAFPPACLQSLDLLGYIGTVCSIYRCEQSTEFGGTVSAENRGIRRKCFKVQKKRILTLGIWLINARCDKVAKQTEGCDSAIISGKAAVFFHPSILHFIGIIFGFGWCRAFKALRQPLAFYICTKGIDLGKKGINSVFLYPCIRETSAKQAARFFIRQIGIYSGFQW